MFSTTPSEAVRNARNWYVTFSESGRRRVAVRKARSTCALHLTIDKKLARKDGIFDRKFQPRQALLQRMEE